MTSELKVPYLGTAEDDILLSAWFVAEGEALHKGQVVAAVETLKAAFDVEADADGVLLRRVVEAGTRIPLHSVIALVGAVGEKVAPDELERLVAAARGKGVAASTGSAARGDVPARSHAPIAPAARRVANESGVDLRLVRGSGPGGLIRVEDVEAAAHADVRRGAAARHVDAWPPKPGSLVSVTTSESTIPVEGELAAPLGDSHAGWVVLRTARGLIALPAARVLSIRVP